MGNKKSKRKKSISFQNNLLGSNLIRLFYSQGCVNFRVLRPSGGGFVVHGAVLEGKLCVLENGSRTCCALVIEWVVGLVWHG